MYKFVHSNGNVDVVTDTTSNVDGNKQVNRSNKQGRGHISDSDHYLTPSETEPDDIEEMSEYPVTRSQVQKLKKTVQVKQRCDGKDVHADLPIYYSTRRTPKQKDAGTGKLRDKSDGRQASVHHMSTHNGGRGRGNVPSHHPSSSSSSESSDEDYKKDDVVHRSNKHHRKRSSVSPNSSKENDSDANEPYKEGPGSGLNDHTRRRHHHSKVTSYGERPKSHKKDYMKPEKYEGTTCFETFLTQFTNCAEYNHWSESEKLAYLRWSLKGFAAQMLWGAKDLTYNW